MSLNSLKNFLRVPSFLTMPAVGLYIGDGFIRFAEIKMGRKTYELGRYGEVPIPDGVFSGGDIVKKDELIKILGKIREDNDLSFVKVSLSEEKCYIFNTYIPKVTKEEARSMLEFKIEENVPLKLEESSFEYAIIKRRKGDKLPNPQDMLLNVSVVQKMVVNIYSDVLSAAGLIPTAFVVESQAVAKSVMGKNEKGAILVVDIKETKTILSVVINGIVWFTSTVPIGERSLFDKMPEATAGNITRIPDKYFKIDEKHSLDFFNASINIFSVIRDEMMKFHQFFKTHKENPFGGYGVGRVVLCGRASALPGLVRYIGSSIEVDTFLADVWKNAFSVEDNVPEIDFNTSLDYATAIGCALPE